MDKQELKLKLFKAIKKVINDSADGMVLDDYFYHPDLEEDMTEAAWNVLMATVKNQQYYKNQA